MPDQSASWLRWVVGMGERRKLGDVAVDLVLFAGMVCAPPIPAKLSKQGTEPNRARLIDDSWSVYRAQFLKPDP